jgi:hypothetical protein
MLSVQGISRNSGGEKGAVKNEYRVVTERRLPGKTEQTRWNLHSFTTLTNITPSCMSCATVTIRGGFTVKLMKLKLQDTISNKKTNFD